MYTCMRISRDKNAPYWRPLSTVMGHCGCTELQKERGILRFPDFSQPSPLCRFHITADSKPRRRHARSVPQPRIHSSRTVLSQIHLDPDKVSTSTQQKSCRCVFAHVWLHDREQRCSVSQARLVNVVWRRRRMRPVSRPDSSPPAGSIKSWRYGGRSV